MSTPPQPDRRRRDADRLPMTLPRLAEKKRLGEPIVMVTAYDYPSARAAEAAGVDLVLVGDSGAMTVLGYPSTVAVELDELLMLAKAVRRGLRTPFLVGDLPFGSYEVSDEQAVAHRAALRQGGRLRRRQARGRRRDVGRARPRDRQRRHPGHGPRRPDAADGDRARRLPRPGPQRRRPPRASPREALALQEAGCFSIVFEAIPSRVAEAIMPRMEIPVIGIGAGPATDGQVLVFHDLLGIREGLGAKFVKRYADLLDEMIAGVAAFADDVRARRYPGPSTATRSTPGELQAFREHLT